MRGNCKFLVRNFFLPPDTGEGGLYLFLEAGYQILNMDGQDRQDV